MKSEYKFTLPPVKANRSITMDNHVKETKFPYTRPLERIYINGHLLKYCDRPGRFIKGDGYNIDRECWVLNNGPNDLPEMEVTLVFDLAPNYTKLSSGMYVVGTQAGFRQAMIDWSTSNNNEPNNWPEQYPAVVSFALGYKGYHYLDVNVVPLNDIESYIRNVDTPYRNSRRVHD